MTPVPESTRRIVTPATYSSSTALRTPVSRTRSGNGDSTVIWTSGDDGTGSGAAPELLPTFKACSAAIIAASERMVVLASEPRSLSVAIAYEECLDIVTAAVNHLERLGSRGALHQDVITAYRAMRDIRELLQPTLPVRRALHF